MHPFRNTVIMLSPVNFLRNYAGFQYIADFLHDKGFNVKLFAHIPRNMMNEADGLPYPVYSCYTGPWGHIPRLRHFAFQRKILRTLDHECKALIVNFTNPNAYFNEAVAFKERFPEKKVILYCSELWLPEEQRKFQKRQCSFCVDHADLPDMIIDVETHRAAIRKKQFRLKQPVFVMPNTLPQESIPKPAPPGSLVKAAGYSPPRNSKILLFVGLASQATANRICAIMGHVSDNVFLLWFAHGSDHEVDAARALLSRQLGGNRVQVSRAIPRIHLQSILYEADAGLVAYSFSENSTLNQKYAAPTKLYEYFAAGLPVVSYGNPSIRKIIEEHNLGICSADETPQSLGNAINDLFSNASFPAMSEHVKNVFKNRLSLERTAGNVLEHMVNIISSR